MTIERDPENGMMSGTKLGNVTDSITYNGFGETDTYKAMVNGSPVFEVKYQTDKLGRIDTKTETVDGVAHTYRYHYDLIGQLTDVYRDGSLVSHYDYDSNGNRVGGTYDDQDRMLQFGGNVYQYTANGELKSKTGADGKTVYSYDVLGNLRAVELANGTKIEYLIDGQNRRIGKKVNGTLVQGFLYQDGLNPVAELNGAGEVVARFVYGTRGNVPDYVVKGGVTYRVISDHLGSPRVILNVATGEVAQKIEYDEFGRVLTDTNPGFTPFGFAGGLYEPLTGLVRFGARYYDAETGRWTAKDPVKFCAGDINLYRYCGNDPINNIDPDGLDWLQNTSDFAAGMGDFLSFGGTKLIRQYFKYDDVVNYCSKWYLGGQITGLVTSVALFVGATAENPAIHKTGFDFINRGTDWLRSNAFRWGTGSWKGGSGLHFHLGPVMKYHLPHQIKTWYHHTKSIITKALK